MIVAKKRLFAAAAGTASVVLLAACSSGGSSSGGGGGPAIDTASYQKAVDEYMAGPSKFNGPTTPVPLKQGIKVAIIPCAVSIGGCDQPAEAVKTVGATIGWTTTILDGQANPRTQNQMIQNAVSSGAQAIFTVAVDSKLVQQGLSAAKAANIPVISMNNGSGTPNPQETPTGLDFNVDVSPNYPLQGKMMADWIIADSKGEAHTLMVVTKDYLSNRVSADAVSKELATCSSCKTDDPLYFVTSEIASGALGSRVVGYLRTHPNVNYIFTGFDAAAAAEIQAIKQAGLDKQVRLVSVTADTVNRGYVRNDDVQHADVVEIPAQSAYAAVDQALRLLAKQPLIDPMNENMDAVLLTKDNMLPDNVGWKLPYDIAAEYKKIWTSSAS